MPKAPSFQFYPGDWLKDPRLRRSSFRARGVWIDIMAIAFECQEKGVLRDENGPFPEREILDMMTGKARDKKAGFDELKRRHIIKQLPDNSYYCKRIYEDWRLSQIRKEAGSKGGNPSLLLNQNPNQTDEQILTPSSSSSSSSSPSGLKEPPKAPKGDSIPYVKIVELYHEHLPNLHPCKIDDQIRKAIKARWGSEKDRQNIEWWSWYFKAVSECDFLMGKETDFIATLPWMIGPRNMSKVLAGQYVNRKKEDDLKDW